MAVNAGKMKSEGTQGKRNNNGNRNNKAIEKRTKVEIMASFPSPDCLYTIRSYPSNEIRPSIARGTKMISIVIYAVIIARISACSFYVAY